MVRPVVTLVLVMFAAAATAARAGDAGGRRHGCRPTAAGTETPSGDTGCGPRYWGAVHDEPGCPDPCDACVRWRGCRGVTQGPEKLAPWQLPPGRGFQSGADVGYLSPRCEGCGGCGPRFPWRF